MTHEIEIFRGRYHAAFQEIIDVVNKLIIHRKFDDIRFKAAQQIWKDDLCWLTGWLDSNFHKGGGYHKLGYLDMNHVSRTHLRPVDVRIVCTWSPMLKYWKKIPEVLDLYYKKLEEEYCILNIETKDETSPAEYNTQVTISPLGDTPIELRMGQPGRKPDPHYDEAYKKLCDGIPIEEVFEWFCHETGVKKPDKVMRDAFKAAMKRRQNKKITKK